MLRTESEVERSWRCRDTPVSQNCAAVLLLVLCVWIASTSTVAAGDFVRARADELVVGKENKPIMLRGVNLGSYFMIPADGGEWYTEGNDSHAYPSPDRDIPVVLSHDWYNEEHFRTAARIGFNVLRVAMTYRIFEDNSNPLQYKTEGWQWLDKYVRWAGKHELYLILNMMVPPGGYQPSGGMGAALWDNPDVQLRFRKLWQAIAERYANEPVIAGYDLLNEPHPTSSATDSEGHNIQWKQLSEKLIADIRAVDDNHLIIVEAVDWVDDGTLSARTRNVQNSFQFPVSDSNAMYDFHFYLPYGYEDGTQGAYPSQRRVTSIDGQSMPFNKRYLSAEVRTVLDVARRNKAPMNFGEWGGTPLSLKERGGGRTFSRDMLELMDEHGIHWTYWLFNNFYTDSDMKHIVPERVNLFTDYFGTSGIRGSR